MEQRREVFQAFAEGGQGSGRAGNAGLNAWLATDRCVWFRYRDTNEVVKDEQGYPKHAYTSQHCVCFVTEDQTGPVKAPGWTVQQPKG